MQTILRTLILAGTLALAASVCAASVSETLERAENLFRQGDYEQVIEIATGILGDDATSSDAHFLIGSASLRLGRLDDAERHLRTATESNPEFFLPGLYFQLGYLAMADVEQVENAEQQRARYEKAVSLFDEELRRGPGQRPVRISRALALTWLERDDEAMQAYEQLIEEKPGDSEPYAALIALHAKADNQDKVTELVHRFPDADRLAANVRSLCGTLMLGRRFEGATTLMRASLERLDTATARSGLNLARSFALAEGEANHAEVRAYLDGLPPWDEATLVGGLIAAAVASRADATPADGPSSAQTPPKLRHRVTPRYPEAARAAGREAIVLLFYRIDADGRADDVIVVPTPATLPRLGFEQAAIRALREWEYEPATRNGEPVAVPFTVLISFRLDG